MEESSDCVGRAEFLYDDVVLLRCAAGSFFCGGLRETPQPSNHLTSLLATMNLSSTCWAALSSLFLASAVVHVAGAAFPSRPARHVGGLLPAFQLSRRVAATAGKRKASTSTCLSAAADDSEGASTVPQKFAIIGHNIAYSVSPAMHTAAYAELQLPHTYGLIDEESVATIVASDFWVDPAFRGMSVTIPHKQVIMPHLDELSDAAERIGAVNTVIVDKDTSGDGRTLKGDNTDWIGIYNPLKARLGDASNKKGGAALILGAGGTARAAAYAATQLGLERVYYNRTPSKAQELADAFAGIGNGRGNGLQLWERVCCF